jgi:hypothetical protein
MKKEQHLPHQEFTRKKNFLHQQTGGLGPFNFISALMALCM